MPVLLGDGGVDPLFLRLASSLSLLPVHPLFVLPLASNAERLPSAHSSCMRLAGFAEMLFSKSLLSAT